MTKNAYNVVAKYRVIGARDVEEAPYDEQQLKGVFKKCDANKDGRLSLEELKNAFKTLGSFLPSWRASRALSHVDRNGDGFIDEEEFGELIKYAVNRGYKYTT